MSPKIVTKIIIVEGNIGVGKSTFIKLFANQFKNSVVIDEPVDLWTEIKDDNGENILGVFYSDIERWAYTFQSMAYVTRMMKIEDKIRENKYDYIFLDRSLGTDRNVFEKMLYDDKKINQIEHQIYNLWADFYHKYVRIESSYPIIYLRAEPEVSFERIKKRGRVEEQNITLDYLQKLHQYHEAWLNSSTQNQKNLQSIIIVDCNKDFEDDVNNRNNIFNDIIKKL